VYKKENCKNADRHCYEYTPGKEGKKASNETNLFKGKAE
jgi:hypothetical protein